MAKSTASFIAYDVRPAKQTERRGVVEFLNCAKHAGFNVSDYRYVGFGGTKFVDFQLMARYVGFDSYQSIEHDEDIFGRCNFNKPFDRISMFKGPFTVFVSTDEYIKNSVYWLDFENSISRDVFDNLKSVAGKISDGDILFATIMAEVPAGMSKGDRKQILKSRLPSFKAAIDKLRPADVTDKNFPDTAGSLLLMMIKSAFAERLGDGQFHPFFKVIYRDSTWMCTVGGVFTKNASRRAGKLKKALAVSLPTMCPPKSKGFYRVPQFNFTQLERLLLDKSAISYNKGYARRLLQLGLEREELEAYLEVSRFVPRYIESAF